MQPQRESKSSPARSRWSSIRTGKPRPDTIGASTEFDLSRDAYRKLLGNINRGVAIQDLPPDDVHCILHHYGLLIKLTPSHISAPLSSSRSTLLPFPLSEQYGIPIRHTERALLFMQRVRAFATDFHSDSTSENYVWVGLDRNLEELRGHLSIEHPNFAGTHVNIWLLEHCLPRKVTNKIANPELRALFEEQTDYSRHLARQVQALRAHAFDSARGRKDPTEPDHPSLSSTIHALSREVARLTRGLTVRSQLSDSQRRSKNNIPSWY